MKHLRNLFGALMLLVTALTLTGCGNGDNALEEIINGGGSGSSSETPPTPPAENPMLSVPLTFEAVEGTIKVTINNANTATDKTIEYKVDDGEWTSHTVTASYGFVTPAGSIIQLRGDNATYYNDYPTRIFSATGNYYVYGNIMSLVDKDNFSTNKTLTGTYTFCGLFSMGGSLNSNLKNHPTKELVLPATTLTKGCYTSMFIDCTNLTKAPELPAETLSDECYYGMFSNCTNLTTAPKLPAMTLANYCYSYMFKNCTSLERAPDLLAPTLVSNCYAYMFFNCKKLSYIKCLATSRPHDQETLDWLRGDDLSLYAGADATTRKFVKCSTVNIGIGEFWENNISGIPESPGTGPTWTVENE